MASISPRRRFAGIGTSGEGATGAAQIKVYEGFRFRSPARRSRLLRTGAHQAAGTAQGGSVMTVELESVMQRLDAQTKRLRQRALVSRAEDEERALTVESLALVSEAVLKIGRDIRQLRLQLGER
jgi:hypothetical protein